MNLETYNNFLTWVLLFGSLNAVVSVILCILWFHISERRISKVVFAFSAFFHAVLFGLRFTVAYQIENYQFRAILGVLFVISLVLGNITLFWAYMVELRERAKRMEAETKLKQANPTMYFIELMAKAHPSDLARLARNLTK